MHEHSVARDLRVPATDSTAKSFVGMSGARLHERMNARSEAHPEARPHATVRRRQRQGCAPSSVRRRVASRRARLAT